MMVFNCLTIFPEMFESFRAASLCGKAIEKGLIDVNTVNFRDYSTDKHHRVDDYPFGGGAGMLLTPQPLFDCFAALKEKYAGKKTLNIYMSPAGKRLSHDTAVMLAGYEVLNILCGHYEGVDQRVLDDAIDMEVSIGDYVLMGGELPAMVLMESVMRFVAGVLGSEESAQGESFANGLLEYPQYTRPQDFRGMQVPEVLVSGHHKNILEWQRAQSLIKTARLRPDLLEGAALSEQDKKILEEINNTCH